VTPAVARMLNAVGLFAVSLVLLVAFVDQLVLGELPCPLCILQRAGFVAVGVGLALNLLHGPRPSHYAMVILSALAGGAVAARQTALHIVPGTGTYGSAFLGMHFYVWALVVFVAIVLGAAVMLLFDRQFAAEAPGAGARLPAVATAVFALATLLALANAVSTGLECGAGLCADNPTTYELLSPPGG
jgi:disulfide bond formation protein DsbB